MGRSVGVILVNWNGWRDTIECLASLRPAMSTGDVRVVVVDNASDDDSVARIEAYAADVTVLVADANHGFAAGNNVGLRFLRERDPCDHYWLLNNDTTIEPDAIDALVRFADRHPSVGLIGSTITEFDEQCVIQCAGGAFYDSAITLNRAALAGTKLEMIDRAPEPAMNYISGAAMFMRGSMIEAVGLLNEDYFLYYEEIDYARRAAAHGYGLGWCRDAIVHHKGGATTGGNLKRLRKRSTVAEYHATLSCLKFTRAFEPSTLARVSVRRFVLKTGYLVSKNQWHLLPTLVRAYVDFFRGDAR